MGGGEGRGREGRGGGVGSLALVEGRYEQPYYCYYKHVNGCIYITGVMFPVSIHHPLSSVIPLSPVLSFIRRPLLRPFLHLSSSSLSAASSIESESFLPPSFHSRLPVSRSYRPPPPHPPPRPPAVFHVFITLLITLILVLVAQTGSVCCLAVRYSIKAAC